MIDKMFGNAAGKLSAIIKVATIIEMIVAVIATTAIFMVIDEDIAALGFLLGIVAAVAIWISSLFLLALLEMMQDVKSIKNKLGNESCGESSDENSYDDAISQIAEKNDSNAILRDGGWRCSRCNHVNPKYLTTCICGMSKSENEVG